MTYINNDIPMLDSIAGVSSSRRAWLCDVWGVLHNGIDVFAPAVEACRAFRSKGGLVVLISNSPRPGPGVAEQLAELNIHRDCYDAVVTSGDVTRSLVQSRPDKTMYHLGPERDQGFFDGIPVRFVDPTKAEVIVCTGLVDDENEDPSDYDPMLADFASRGALMICGNPDLMVERGNRLIPCAGALAARYEALGQAVIQAGKPYKPIYELAMKQLPDDIELRDVLAIGDGVDTDIRGAASFGIDAVYIVSRVNLSDETGNDGLNVTALRALFTQRNLRPLGALPQLAW